MVDMVHIPPMHALHFLDTFDSIEFLQYSSHLHIQNLPHYLLHKQIDSFHLYQTQPLHLFQLTTTLSLIRQFHKINLLPYKALILPPTFYSNFPKTKQLNPVVNLKYLSAFFHLRAYPIFQLHLLNQPLLLLVSAHIMQNDIRNQYLQSPRLKTLNDLA